MKTRVLPFQRSQQSAASGYKVVARGNDAAEIYLYGLIGEDFWGDGISAKRFADDLKALGSVKKIAVRINSEGGDVFAGKAMYTLLAEHAATIEVHIDGLAASAASFVAMAGASIRIAEGAFVMVHNAWTLAVGDAASMRRTADLLDSVNGTIRDVYVARTGQTSAKITELMDAETWMTGPEAIEMGFADILVENLSVAAAVHHPSRFRNLPAALRPRRAEAVAALDRLRR